MNQAALSALGTGFFSSVALIMAIGAQNTFVLRQGLKREHVGLIVLICCTCDVVLVAVGVAGLGAAIGAQAWLVNLLRYGGAAFLAGYALLAARRAFSSYTLDIASKTVPISARAAAMATLGFTLLNPHVYLDTVLLLGALGAQQPGALRWLFLAGCSVAAVLWFASLGYGARVLAPLFARPMAWRVLDAAVALLMMVLALLLLLKQ